MSEISAKSQSRKWLLTINNYEDYDAIKNQVLTMTNVLYWCIGKEVGEEGTPHLHVYFVRKSPMMFSAVKNRFPRAHIDKPKGSSLQVMEYCSKTGKWLDDEKADTSIGFEEGGELPDDDNQGQRNDFHKLKEMLEEGLTDVQIIEQMPQFITKLDKVGRARQIMLQDAFADEWRDIEVTYMYGDSGIGKTRSVMEKYGYRNVYRVTDYDHPFDSYNGQDVIIFDEFHGKIKITNMLVYLDGYPVELPARYYNRQACYTKVYIQTNIPLEEQYKSMQGTETWKAFRRRIHRVVDMRFKVDDVPWEQMTIEQEQEIKKVFDETK